VQLDERNLNGYNRPEFAGRVCAFLGADAAWADGSGAARVVPSADVMARLDELINQKAVHGPRYLAGVQMEIDTEEFKA
jgi:hypothetical protein